MKPFATKLFALLTLLVLVLALGLVGCNGNPGETAAGSCTVVIGGETETVYTVALSEVIVTEGLRSVLAHLAATEGLTVAYRQDGVLTRVGDLVAHDNVYLWLYTSVEADFDVSVYATTIDYHGRTLVSPGVGVAEMTVEDGAVYYIGTIDW